MQTLAASAPTGRVAARHGRTGWKSWVQRTKWRVDRSHSPLNLHLQGRYVLVRSGASRARTDDLTDYESVALTN